MTSSPTSVSLSDPNARSALVATAFTSGCASALLVSMETMRAWACGLRSMAP